MSVGQALEKTLLEKLVQAKEVLSMVIVAAGTKETAHVWIQRHWSRLFADLVKEAQGTRIQAHELDTVLFCKETCKEDGQMLHMGSGKYQCPNCAKMGQLAKENVIPMARIFAASLTQQYGFKPQAWMIELLQSV